MTFITKDSGERVTYDTGMNRDSEDKKPRTDLIDRGLLRELVAFYCPNKLKAFDYFERFFWDGESIVPAIDEVIKAEGITPYQFIERLGFLMKRGAEKYSENNWLKANSEEELRRFRHSAHRHMTQCLFGEIDEDHMTAGFGFNPAAIKYVKNKLQDR